MAALRDPGSGPEARYATSANERMIVAAQPYRYIQKGTGSVYGATDRTGGYPADGPVSPADLMATLHHLLGIPPDTGITDPAGRPHRACHGTPVRGLLA